MKKLFLATVSLVALAGSAMAADLPVYKAAPVVAAPACAQFGGFYFGGNVGWKYYDHRWKDKDNYGFNFTFSDHIGNVAESDNGWTAGAQVGYNFQWHCTVWGIQADWNWTNAEATNHYTDFPLVGAGQLSYSSEEKWYGTLRTRSGVVVDNLLLYVTGGFAWAKFDRNLVYSIGNPAFVQSYSSDATRLGFVVGVGTEWAWTQNWSVNSEILYMGFEKDNQTFSCSSAATCPGGAAFIGTPYRYEFKDSEWVAKIGVNYRFGGAAPIVARY